LQVLSRFAAAHHDLNQFDLSDHSIFSEPILEIIRGNARWWANPIKFRGTFPFPSAPALETDASKSFRNANYSISATSDWLGVFISFGAANLTVYSKCAAAIYSILADFSMKLNYGVWLDDAVAADLSE
jgi:hypothetical protein